MLVLTILCQSFSRLGSQDVSTYGYGLPAKLFQNDEPLFLTLSMDIRTVIRDIEEEKNHPAEISYFDQENGQSPVRFYVNGKEKATFRMDEDTDCWRWRQLNKIRIRKGDEIMLEARAVGDEHAILEFIEFIPMNR